MQGIVLGQTGSGKTTLLRNIITQDLARRVGRPGDRHKIPMVIFDGKGDLEFFHSLLPHIHRAGRLQDLRLLNPARPDISVLYNPFHSDDDNYMAQVNMVFGSFNLHDEFFAKHQLNYLADIVRVLTYTGLRYNFYDVIVMALDEKVLREQTEKARKRIEHDPSISTQRRLNFEMSVKNLFQSLQDRERVPKIQGLLNECMTFLDDELSVITGPYEDLLSIDDVIEQELILFVTLNVNKNTEPVRALGKMLLQNLQLVVGKRYESEEQRQPDRGAAVQRRARRICPVRLQELRTNPANGPRNQDRVPVFDAEPAATHASRPRLQGRRDVRSEHDHHPAHARRRDGPLLHPRIRAGNGFAAKLQPGAATGVRSRMVRKDGRGDGARGQGVSSEGSRREDTSERADADSHDRRCARRAAFAFTRSCAGGNPRAVFRAGAVLTSASFAGGHAGSQSAIQESGDRRTVSAATASEGTNKMKRRVWFLALFLAASCPLYGQAYRSDAPSRETWYERALRQINPNDTDWGAIWEQHKREFLNQHRESILPVRPRTHGHYRLVVCRVVCPARQSSPRPGTRSAIHGGHSASR